MYKLDNAHDVMGLLEHGPEDHASMAIFEGNLVGFGQERLAGAMKYKIKGSKSASNHYLFGRSHVEGLSLLNIPKLDINTPVTIWTLREERGIYRGAWMPLDTTLATIGLSGSKELAELIKLDPGYFDILSAGQFREIIQEGESHGRKVVLDLKEADLDKVRRDLRI